MFVLKVLGFVYFQILASYMFFIELIVPISVD